MRALMRGLIELYAGLLQWQGYAWPASGLRVRDARVHGTNRLQA